MNVRKLLVLLVAALALVAAGCGGDGGSEASGDTEETTVATETNETESEETSTEDSSATTTDDSALDDLSGKCTEFAGISARLSQSLSGQTADLEDAARVFDEIADQVPEEIRADYQVIAENFSKIAEALKGTDLTSGEAPSPEALAKLQEVSASLDSAEVQEASQNIEAWVQENC